MLVEQLGCCMLWGIALTPSHSVSVVCACVCIILLYIGLAWLRSVSVFPYLDDGFLKTFFEKTKSMTAEDRAKYLEEDEVVTK